MSRYIAVLNANKIPTNLPTTNSNELTGLVTTVNTVFSSISRHITPDAVTRWLNKPEEQLPSAEKPIDLSGLIRLVDFVGRLTNQKGAHHAHA